MQSCNKVTLTLTQHTLAAPSAQMRLGFLYLSGLLETFCAQSSLTRAKPSGRATSGLRKYVLGRMFVITCAARQLD